MWHSTITTIKTIRFLSKEIRHISLWIKQDVSVNGKNQISIKIIDEGQGFKEKDTSRIFKRFYSNRPEKFGEHSGLGLNIVKNLVELHDGEIVASNRIDKEGAMIEIRFPNV